MKRISILLALTLSLSLLSACGGNEPAASTGNPSSEPTRRTPISYAVFCLKKKNDYCTLCAAMDGRNDTL